MPYMSNMLSIIVGSPGFLHAFTTHFNLNLFHPSYFNSTPLISTSEAAGLREFESAPKDITSQYPIHNYTNLSSQIKQVEETPYIAVNAVIDQIYASIPLFNHYPGWQGQFVR
jgi:hypothetical protein